MEYKIKRIAALPTESGLFIGDVCDMQPTDREQNESAFL